MRLARSMMSGVGGGGEMRDGWGGWLSEGGSVEELEGEKKTR